MLTRRHFLQGSVAAAFATKLGVVHAAANHADTIYTNGTVWTGDSRVPLTNAFAVTGERFSALGKDAAFSLKTKRTRIVDLQGAFVTPGLIDNHTHFLMGAKTLKQVNLRQAATPEQFTDIIAGRAKSLPEGEWIEGGNWDEQLWGGELPTKEWIDKVTPNHPVAVARLDLHMLLLNSAALKAAGIDKNTPTPPGGEIVRDAKGNPTGILKDQAKELVLSIIPADTMARNIDTFKQGIQHGLRHGVTQCHIMGSSWESHNILMAMREKAHPQMRFQSYVPIQDWKKLLQQINDEGFGDQWVGWGGLKGLFDGSLGSRTALFHDAYHDDASTHGITVQDTNDLREWTQQADQHGLRVSLHAIGDEANDEALDIFEHTIKQNGKGKSARRFTIEHAQHLTKSAVPRFAQLGVIPCVQPYHAIDDGRWAVKRIGEERLTGTYAFHSLLQAGATLSFGSDWPVAPLDPVKGIEAAVLRQTIDGKNPDGWLPDEKVTVEQALQAYTINNAYAAGQQDELGSISTGKRADFVVMDNNLLTAPTGKIGSTRILQTNLSGKAHFSTL